MGKASDDFVISSREIIPKHLPLKNTVFIINYFPFISLYMRAKVLYWFSKLLMYLLEDYLI